METPIFLYDRWILDFPWFSQFVGDFPMIYHRSWIFPHDFPTIFTIDFTPTPAAVHVGVPQLRGAAGDVVGLETFQVFFFVTRSQGKFRPTSWENHGKIRKNVEVLISFGDEIR